MRTNFSGHFIAFTPQATFRAPGSGWPPFSGLSTATAAACGPKAQWTKVQYSISHWAERETQMAEKKIILLVEDNPDDAKLAMLALEKNGAAGKMVVVHDGAEALDYLFGAGAYAGRDMGIMPSLILLDLKLPKVNGLEVLRRLRADPRTQIIPVVVLTSSHEEMDLIESYKLGCNSYLRKPVDFARFIADVGQVARYWLRLNEPPPKVVQE
jgi:CheY-like chemotaxis protein